MNAKLVKFEHVGRRKRSTECIEKLLENLQMKMTFEAYMSIIVRIVWLTFLREANWVLIWHFGIQIWRLLN